MSRTFRKWAKGGPCPLALVLWQSSPTLRGFQVEARNALEKRRILFVFARRRSARITSAHVLYPPKPTPFEDSATRGSAPRHPYSCSLPRLISRIAIKSYAIRPMGFCETVNHG